MAVLVDLVLPLAASLGEDVEVGPLHAPVLGLFGVKSLRRLRRRRGTANLEREKTREIEDTRRPSFVNSHLATSEVIRSDLLLARAVQPRAGLPRAGHGQRVSLAGTRRAPAEPEGWQVGVPYGAGPVELLVSLEEASAGLANAVLGRGRVGGAGGAALALGDDGVGALQLGAQEGLANHLAAVGKITFLFFGFGTRTSSPILTNLLQAHIWHLVCVDGHWLPFS